MSGFSTLFRFLSFAASVSGLSRFINEDGMSEKLNRRNRRRIFKLLKKTRKNPNRYIWAIDDTLISHSGENIWGTYCWHDHSTQGYIKGHKWLVLGLVDRDKNLFFPVFWKILHREDKETKSIHKKGWEIALDLLDEAINFGFEKFTVCADSWFGCQEFFDALNERGFHFVFQIKSNRKISVHKERAIDENICDFFSNLPRRKIFYQGRKKWASEATLLLKGAKKKLKIVSVSNKKGLAIKAFSYYASNRLTWDASMIWSIARSRWSIEVQFRDLKQLFTLGETAVRSKQAVETSISLSVIALTAIRMEQLAQANTNKNQYVRPIPAGEIVNEIKLESLKKGISKLASLSETKSKRSILIRLCKKNFGKKPTEDFERLKSQDRSLKLKKVA